MKTNFRFSVRGLLLLTFLIAFVCWTEFRFREERRMRNWAEAQLWESISWRSQLHSKTEHDLAQLEAEMSALQGRYEGDMRFLLEGRGLGTKTVQQLAHE